MTDFLKKITGSDEELNMNITSMIDVIFILLIFFMVSTQFKKTSLPLDLPRTENSSEAAEDNSEKILCVNRDSIKLGEQEISMENLESALSEICMKNPDASFSIECDRAVEFERVVQILTKLQNAGISRIGIIHETMDD